MKKICISLLCLLVLAGFWGCSQQKQTPQQEQEPMLSIEGAAWAVLRDGNTGDSVTIKDAEALTRLQGMLCAPAYEQGESSKEWMGWSYSLDWYDETGEPLDSIVVDGAQLVDYSGFFWSLSGGEIDTDYLDELLAVMPGSDYCDMATRMTYGRGEPFRIVFSDEQGGSVEIRDAESMDRILDNLCGLTFAVAEPAEADFKYLVAWEDDSAMLVDDRTVWRNGYHYTAIDGQVDLPYLLGLLADPPPIKQDMAAAQAVLDRAFDVEGANTFTISGGPSVSFTEPPEMWEIALELLLLDFVPVENYEGPAGPKYSLRWAYWHMHGCETLKEIDIMDANTIRVDDYYFVSPDPIDLARIERLQTQGAAK